jgi:hypothetical protein
MKRFSEQIHTQASKVRMSAAEKRELSNRITTFMEYHPVTPVRAKTTSRQAIEQSPFFILKIPGRYLQSFSLVTVMLVFVIMPMMAEKAVPGDVLYPIKVRVNEEVVSSFNRTAYDKIEWETKRLERRLAEARVLAEEGRLTAEVEADVVAAVKQHTTDAANTIAEIRTEDSEQAALAEMTLATRLSVQGTMLQSALAASDGEGVSVEGIAAAVSVGQSEAIEREALDGVSFERLVAQLEQETTRLYELLRTLRESAAPKDIADIERRIADIERRMQEAILGSTDAPAVSIESLRQVWIDAQKLIAYSTDLDIRATVSLDLLVPVVLTDEERLLVLDTEYAKALATLEALESDSFTGVESAIVEKITASLPGIADALEIVGATKVTDIAAAEIIMKEQTAVLDSIVALLQWQSIPEAATTTPSVVVPAEPVATTTSTTTPEQIEETETE